MTKQSAFPPVDAAVSGDRVGILRPSASGAARNPTIPLTRLPISELVQAELDKKATKPLGTATPGYAILAGSTGAPEWSLLPTGGSGGGGTGTGLNPIPATLTDAATVTPDAAAADFFNLQATTLANRIIAKPSGVSAARAKRIHVLFKQDSVGGRTVSFSGGITAYGEVDPAPNAITLLTMTTADGGTNWIVDGLGINPGNDKVMATNFEGKPVAVDNVRQASFCMSGAPTNAKVYPLVVAPFAGRIRSMRSYVEAGSVTLTARIGATAVGGLSALQRDGGSATVAATGQNTFTAGQLISVVPTASAGLSGIWAIYLDMVQSA